MSFDTHEWLKAKGVYRDLPGTIEVMPSKYCPTWTKPSWWRRWFHKEKPKRYLYRLDIS